MYASDVWATTHLEPGKGSKQNGWGARGFGKKIETVQHTATLAITGGMHSTATDLLLAHADLLPIPVLIRQHTQRATLQLTTIPQHHPLHKHIIQALRQHRHHKSPLHHILLTFPLDPRKTETIQPIRHSTKWSPQTKINIRDKDEAIEHVLAEETEDTVLYSDGSGHDGKIGAAAVLRHRGRQVSSLHFELGADTDHTVYKGEIVCMILAIELLKKAPRARKISLAINNKAVILATRTFSSKPGHYLMDIFHENLQTALKRHHLNNITVRWTPGHTGIPGNEEADKEAKEAVSGNITNPSNLPRQLRTRTNRPKNLPRSKSATKQELQAHLKTLQQSIFQSSPRAERCTDLDPTLPSYKFLKLVADLLR